MCFHLFDCCFMRDSEDKNTNNIDYLDSIHKELLQVRLNTDKKVTELKRLLYANPKVYRMQLYTKQQ